MKIILLFIIIVLNLNIFSQTTYYVSSSTGNDTNIGTSPSLAWKTIDKVNQQTFTAGDVILFKKGDIWEGERLEVMDYSGTETSLITFGAYPQAGTAKPIISTITTHTHTWINQGANIWKSTNPPNYHPERLFVDGTEILRANNISELDGINFFWLYDADENGDLYLYSDTDPSSKEIKYTENIVALYCENTNYIVFTNINFQGSWTSVYINSNTSYLHFNEVNFGKFASGGVVINSENASVPNHIYIKNSTFDSDFTLDYSMSATYEGQERGTDDGIIVKNAQYCEIDSCYFKNWGHANISLDGNNNGVGDVKVSYISVHDNYLTSPDICYGGRIGVDDAHHCEVFNNQIINTSVQSQLNGYNNHFHHNIFDGTRNSPLNISGEIDAGVSIEAYSNTDTHHNIFENNLIKNTVGVGFQIVTSGDYNIHNNIIRNNIIYNCGTHTDVTGIGIFVEEDGITCETSNNIFYNNLVFNENTTNTINFRGAITDIAGFNALTGISDYQINANISGNPLFVDVNNADYHLSENSPCIDAGTNSLATLDFEGNTIPFDGTATDIGIYESQFTNIFELFNDGFLVYPNPAKDFIEIINFNSLNIKNISILNLNGQIVLRENFYKNKIDLKALQAGIYFLRIETSNDVQFRKFIIK